MAEESPNLKEILKQSAESLSKASVLNNDIALKIIFELFTAGDRTDEYLLNEFGSGVIKSIALLYANEFIVMQEDKIKLSEYGYEAARKINTQASLNLKAKY